MRSGCTGLLAIVLVFAASRAAAQSAAPRVELGIDLSATLVPNEAGLQRGPRVLLNLDDASSLQFTASLQRLAPWDDLAQKETDLYLAAYRRLVHASGRIRVLATIGGGVERSAIFVPAITFGNPPVTFPSSQGVEILPAFTSGVAVDFRVWRRAAIVVESAALLTGRLGGRFSGGVVVPLGSYPERPTRLAPSVPWATLDPGERAWVTTVDDRTVEGQVLSRSAATLRLRTLTGVESFAPDDVRAIDTTDPIRNGTLRGALIGTAGALVPSILATFLVCALEEGCDGRDVLAVNGLLLGIGAGVGAAAGAMIDGLREGRVPLYRRGQVSRVTLAPLVSTDRLGGRAVIRW